MDKRSSARLREAGLELKAQRERNDLSLRQLARRIPWDASRVSLWERGMRPLDPVDAATVLGACVTPSPEYDRIMELIRPPSDLYWVRPYFDKLVNPLKSVIIQESQAASITYFDPMAIPGLLQIEDYTRTAFEMVELHTADRINVLVKARMDRQRILQRRNPPRCAFFVHERALRAVVGGSELMHEQLQYLVLCMNLPHCRIRIVPESTAAFRLLGDVFAVMEFAEHPTVVYNDTFAAGLFIDDRAGVENFYVVVNKLEQTALSERQSLEWLTRMASEYERMKE